VFQCEIHLTDVAHVLLQIIISEMALPYHRKTIKPLGGGIKDGGTQIAIFVANKHTRIFIGLYSSHSFS
jgi:hypothetical protein